MTISTTDVKLFHEIVRLLENIDNFLWAEALKLVLGDRLVWWVNIILILPSRTRWARSGWLEIDANS